MNNNNTRINLNLMVLEKPLDEFRFKSIFECLVKNSKFKTVCHAKFRTLKELERHHDIRHPEKPLKYHNVVVGSKYIEKRMDECHTKIVVFSHADSLYHEAGLTCEHKKTLPNSCYLRICPKCEKTRHLRNAKTYKDVVEHFKRLNFLTLTCRGHKEFKPSVKNDLERDVKKFIDMLKYRFKGYPVQYVRVLETVKKDDGVYYHYHFLIDVPYVHQTVLSEIWKKATNNDSFIVDIRHVGHVQNTREGQKMVFSRGLDQHDPIMYVSKYLSKPLSNITPKEYAGYVYRERFVETRLKGTSLVSIRNNRRKIDPIPAFFKCSECGFMLRYTETRDLTFKGVG